MFIGTFPRVFVKGQRQMCRRVAIFRPPSARVQRVL
jgi:hypothetical protein